MEVPEVQPFADKVIRDSSVCFWRELLQSRSERSVVFWGILDNYRGNIMDTTAATATTTNGTSAAASEIHVGGEAEL